LINNLLQFVFKVNYVMINAAVITRLGGAAVLEAARDISHRSEGKADEMLIFLDIDGVLNSVTWIGGGCARGPIPPTFADDALVEELLDSSCIARLRRIVEVTGAKIVLSSSWRYRMSPEELAKLFAFHGFANAPIVGVTPDLPGPRGAQVRARIERNASCETAQSIVRVEASVWVRSYSLFFFNWYGRWIEKA
jgi:HAD domain in Swiss Army Knife RNA repair proteins